VSNFVFENLSFIFVTRKFVGEIKTNIWFLNGGIFFKYKHLKTKSALKCRELFFAVFLIEAIKIQKFVEIISIRYKI